MALHLLTTLNMQLSPKNKLHIAICHVQVPFIHGGAEVLVNELILKLKDKGHTVELIQIPFQWQPHHEIIKNAAVWRMIDIDTEKYTGRKIDLVICTKFPAYLVKHPNKVVWLFHQFRDAYDLNNSNYSLANGSEGVAVKNLIREMDNRFIPEARKIYTISKNVSNRLSKFNKINSEVIYPGLKNEEKYHCNEYGSFVLCVSRINKIKRPEILLKSIKHVKNKDIKYIFVGKDEGGYLDELKRQAHNDNVEERIEFKADFISDEELRSLYANALTCVFCPYDEDYGYVTLESFFSKKPVITTSDSGGPLEFVEHKKNGYVLAPNDYTEIAASIDALADNRALAQKMGEAGYEKVKDITWDNAINMILNEQ